MAQAPDFNGFIPGMEFFQTLLKGAGMPSQFASWVAPTMDVDEIERKITDLKAVLNWLEANSRMTQNLIQALEVQRMTLSALKTMNVDMQSFARGFASEIAAAQPTSAPAADSKRVDPVSADATQATAEPASEARPLLDPMQWWTAMTRQFTEIAAQALQEGGAAFDAGSGAAEPRSGAHDEPAASGPARSMASGGAPKASAARARRAATSKSAKPVRSPKQGAPARPKPRG